MTEIKKYTKNDGTNAYMFNVYVGKHPRTKKNVYRKRQGFKTKKQAQIALAEIIKDIDENGIEDEKKAMTFNDLYELWLNQHKMDVKPSTLREQTSFIKNHVLPTLGEMDLNKISVLICQKLVNDTYDSGLKRFSYVRSVTSQIMKFGVVMEVMKNNPMVKTILPRKTGDTQKLKYYTKEQLTHFFECLKLEGNYEKFAYFRMLAFTGSRKSEAMALKWKNIDFVEKTVMIENTVAKDEDGNLIIQPPKTSSSIHAISLDHDTLKILSKWRTIQRTDFLMKGINTSSDEQFVFTNKRNELYNLTTPNYWLKQIIKKYNLPKITPHHFRHTHASLLLQAGVPLKEVSERLGHKDISITDQIYSHVMPEEKKKTADKFAKFVGF